jgi:sortase A
MSFWRSVAFVGKALIWSGLLILAFVGYELWGTGLAEARNQDHLRKQFKQALETPAAAATTTSMAQAPPPPPTGNAVAIIKFPKLNEEKTVVEGVSVEDLKKGPGHYPETPMPGHAGNVAIAGHRTTYGAPFYRLDELNPGDDIFITTKEGQWRYSVTGSKVVSPNDSSVLDPTSDNRLTLTTCHPRFTASQRLIITAALVGKASTVPVAPPAAATGGAKLEKAGLSGARVPRQPAVGWGTAAGLAWLATWALSRLWRRWPSYAIGAPVFLVLLFLFFENFSRLLPANI